ncbi:PAPA-1 domain-containing protein [Mycena kentingensis (nom. inval.)]|nr:PAPA-1 domain-containing protein [Mycena kentingensis (nom. inval.)]
MPMARRLPSEEESEVDIAAVAENVHETSEEEEEADVEADVEDEDELEDELEDDPEEQPKPLKIMLKLPATTTATPGRGRAPPRRAAAAAAARRLPKNEDVESEDDESEEEESEDGAVVALANGRLTARQAALANANSAPNAEPELEEEPEAEPESATLPATSSGRKRAASPSQVALRKEENARKRKNKIEKKLEDEKLETINRLLKKQTRPKGKRGPAPGQAVAAAVPSDEEADMEGEEHVDAVVVPPTPVEPPKPMYRWISTSRPPARSTDDGDAMQVDETPVDAALASRLAFCVPDALMPSSSVADASDPLADASTRCAVDGCSARRKYRAVGRDWGVGACGLPHLKLLQASA